MRSPLTNYCSILFFVSQCFYLANPALAQNSNLAPQPQPLLDTLPGSPDSIAPASLTISSPPALPVNPNPTPPTNLPISSPPALPAVQVPSNTLPIIPIDACTKKITGKAKKKAHYVYPRPNFAITGKFNRIFQKCTGITYISEVTTDFVAQKILKRKFGGKVKVIVKTYSFTDLIHLKVRIATVRMTGSHYKEIPLGKIEIQSRTPFWLGLGEHKRPSLQEVALLSFKTEYSDKELDQILHSERVTNAMRFLKLDLSSLGPGLDEQKLQMHEPELRLDDGSIILKTTVATPNADPSTGSTITVSGKPQLRGDDLVYLEEVKVESPDIEEPERFSKFVENLINPLINLKRFDKYNFAMRLDEVSVKPHRLSISGRIILGPVKAVPKSVTLPAAKQTKLPPLPDKLF